MNTAGLDAAQRRALREHLEGELTRLRGEIRSLTEMTAPVAPDRAIGRLSRLEAMNEKSMNEASLHQARALESRVRAALARVEEEDFGLCVRCDEAIPFLRLKSVPGTRLCVACAEKAGG